MPEYRFDKYKSNKEEIKEFNVNFEILKEKKKQFLNSQKKHTILWNQYFARDLVNTPAMDLYPETQLISLKKIQKNMELK